MIYLGRGLRRLDDGDGRRKTRLIGGFSNFIAIIPARLLCQMYANSPRVEFQENSHRALSKSLSKFGKRKKISENLVLACLRPP